MKTSSMPEPEPNVGLFRTSVGSKRRRVRQRSLQHFHAIHAERVGRSTTSGMRRLWREEGLRVPQRRG